MATTVALSALLAPAGAQADGEVKCTDNKPANGFSFTCDAALSVPAPGLSYPAPDGVSFSLFMPPLDAYSTLEITAFDVPGSQCSRMVGTSSDSLLCSTAVPAGQTVSGTIEWAIGYHPRVPLANCTTAQFEGYTADPGPEGETYREVRFPIQVCQASTSMIVTSSLTTARAKSAARSALSTRFGRSWRKGTFKNLTCAPLGKAFDCKVSWRRRTRRYKGHVVVSESNGRVRTQVHVQ